MDDPQPNATPPEGAGAPAEPSAGATATAAQPQEPQQSQQPPDNGENFDYEAWLQQKGVDPSTPEGKAAIAKSWRGIEQKMHETTMQASELRKSLTQPSQPAQPAQGGQADNGMQEFIADYRRDKLISGFKESHSDWKDHEQSMVKLLSEATPSGYTRSQLVNAGVMSLEDIYAMARQSAPDNTKQIQADAKNEVLQTLANTQRAGGGTSQASDPNPQGQKDDPINAAIRAARGENK